MSPTRRRLKDPRVWFGLAVTVLAMYFALRGVDLAAVGAEFRRANLVILLGLSLPSYLLVVWLRAVRWRYFTDAVAPMPRGALFRAVAIGFMANNLFPLRMGEFVRSWYLGREMGVAPASILGTVILERVVDTLMVILLALVVVLALGGQSAATWTRGLLLLLPVALLPFATIAWLKIAPDQVLAIAAAVTRPLSTRVRSVLLSQLERFGEGLGAVRGGSHLFWIAAHTASIWLVASTIPMLAGFLALGVDFGTPLDNLAAAWMTLAAVGIAVALPSAPGFFGLYHSACRLVFERFGIPAELAVALGTLLHAVFWVSLTALGFAVLRARRTSLGELDAAAGPDRGDVR